MSLNQLLAIWSLCFISGLFACPPGQYSWISWCLPCSAGTYSSEGSSACTTCPAGTYSGTGAAKCIPCPPGQYSSSEGSMFCQGCEPGSYAESPGSKSCTKCETGSIASFGSSKCTACPAGTYQLNAQTCLNCLAGWYSASAGSASCTQCPAGSTSSAGSSSCTSCPAGKYAPVGHWQCIDCPLGSYSNSSASSCTPCSPGSFASGSGSAACTQCAPGTYAAGHGSLWCSNCPSGYYSDSFGSIYCQKCPPGTTSSFGGSQCTRCAAGTYSSADNIFCWPCLFGTYSLEGSSSCGVCPAGSYIIKGTAKCALCPAGKYSATAGSPECLDCPAGQFSLTGSTSCMVCPAGYYSSLKGSKMCEICPEGKFSSLEGSTLCSVCPPDTFSAAGSTRCQVCPPNAVCSPGNFSCRNGFGKNGTECVDCIELGMKNVDGICVTPVASKTESVIPTPLSSLDSSNGANNVNNQNSITSGGIQYIIYLASALGFLVLFGIALWIWIGRRKRRVPKYFTDTAMTNISVISDISDIHSIDLNQFDQQQKDCFAASSTFDTLGTCVNTTVPLALPAFLMVDFEKDVKLDKKLGKGGFSVVHEAAPLSTELKARSRGNSVAVKVLNEPKSEEENGAFSQEVALMADLARNDNFVKLLGYSVNPRVIIMPIYELGDFADLIHDKREELKKLSSDWSPSFVLTLLSDLANALEFLHEREISHNDVKPANVLLDQRQDRLHLVLSDFSFSDIRNTMKKGVQAFHFSEADGLSLPYAPPELLAVMQQELSPEAMKTWPIHGRDTYAFGIIVCEAASRCLPYTMESISVFAEKIRNGHRPDTEAFLQNENNARWKPVMDIAIRCWAALPENRPRLHQVLPDFLPIQQSDLSKSSASTKSNATAAHIRHNMKPRTNSTTRSIILARSNGLARSNVIARSQSTTRIQNE